MSVRRQARAGFDQTAPHGIPGALLSRFHQDWSDPKALRLLVAEGYIEPGDLKWLKGGASTEMVRHRCLAYDPDRLGIEDPNNPGHVDYHALRRLTQTRSNREDKQ